MKLLYTLFVLTISCAFVTAQDIPNASFENWSPYSLGEYPDNWTTSDSISRSNSGGPSVTKSTDSYDGTSSLSMKSVQVIILGFPITGPGIATNGLVNLVGASFVFSGGSPDTARSRHLTGWFKYNPLNPNDAAIVKVYLLGDSSGVRDTAATAVWEHTGAVSTFTQFVIPMVYEDFDLQPDTCLIILQSSRNINDPNLGVGSEFIVDSLGFSGFVGIDELKNAVQSVNVFPSPATDELNISVELNSKIALTWEIYDMKGRRISGAPMKSENEKVDVSGLAAGRYILKIGDAKGNPLHSKKISISK